MAKYSIKQIVEFEFIVEADSRDEAIELSDELHYGEAKNQEYLVWDGTNDIYKIEEIK
jgi:hypothetical protein